MKSPIAIHRFIEREYEYIKILHNSRHLTLQQINQILDGIGNWSDLTFKFYADGSLDIIDNNNSEAQLTSRDLTGSAYDFYVKKRIEFIKTKVLQSA